MDNSAIMARRIQRGYRVIASVYPGKLPVIERPFDGTTQYSIPPREKGESPFLLKVYDAVQIGRDPMVRETLTEALIFCDQVCSDLLDKWARTPIGAPPGSGPGLALIEKDTPSKAELAYMHERQQMLFEHWYQEALGLFQDRRFKDIYPHHRLSAHHLGREEPWAIDLSVPAEPLNLEPCPACLELINAKAYVCPKCSRTIRALPKHLADLQKQGQAA